MTESETYSLKTQYGLYLVLFILEWDLEVLRCTDHSLHGGEDVLVDQFGESFLVLICVT